MAKRKKKTQSRVRRRVLTKFKDADGDIATFYTNGEFRFKSWGTCDYSEWKIEDGHFWYKHALDKDFDWDGDDDDAKLVALLEKALIDFEFEKTVLK